MRIQTHNEVFLSTRLDITFAAFLLVLCFLADKLYFFLLPEVFHKNSTVTAVTAHPDPVSSNSINKHRAFCVAPSPSATTRLCQRKSVPPQVCTGDFVKVDSDLPTRELGKRCLAVCSCCARAKQNCELPGAPFHDTGLSGLATCFLPHRRGVGLLS